MKKILLITAAVLFTFVSSANTITVTNINDTGAGSLRQASIDAASGDTIRFSPSLLTATVDSISLATEIDFGSKAIVIKGLYTATDTLFISGANSSRIFSFNSAGKVVLDSVVLINGNGAGAVINGNGGAVLYYEGSDTLHVVNSTISNNHVSNNGGGIYIQSLAPSFISVSNSTISNNSASSYGGGIYFTSYTSSSVIINNSTISNNSASTDGGGIYSYSDNFGSSSSSSVTVSNSTISNNSASSNGGGIYSLSVSFESFSSSEVTVNNSTFSNNSATAASGGISSSSSSSSVITIGSSIFTGNGVDNQGANAVTSNGYNIFSDGPTGTVGTDQTNVTPVQLNLGPLQNNGGTTLTMMPGAGSVALDAGNPSDMSDAQNGPILGIRDVGAAESVCQLAGTYNETVCFGDSITVNGTVYKAGNLTGIEVFTNVGANNCDSTVTVNLTILPEITDQTVTSSQSSFCNSGSTSINLSSSDVGIDYYLRNDANDTIVAGPVAGTGSGISLNTGTLTSTTTFNVYGDNHFQQGALEFDGNDDYVGNVSGINIANSSFTFEAWVKRSSLSGSDAMLFGQGTNANNQGLHIGFRSNNTFTVAYWFNDLNTSATFTDLNWHHWAVTYDTANNERIIYRDGTPIESDSASADYSGTGNLEIGRFLTGSHFDGEMDEVRVWNIARTPSEIMANYMGCVDPTSNGLLTYLKFDDLSGSTTAEDATLNGNDGTLTNFDVNTSWINGHVDCGVDSCGSEMSTLATVTVNNSATGTDTRTECNSYTWIDGMNYTSSNNSATFNIVGGGANGCDSLVTLDLTIVNSTTGTDTRTECNSYTWIDGMNYASNNNTATFNIVGGAANGCDSLVTLDLTIVNSTTGTDTRTECNSYTWIDGMNYTSNNNTATFNIVGGAANGCDSLVTLDLAIVNSSTGTDTRTECNSYTWIDGNTYTASNNTATHNILGGAANGCDSLVTLDLTINNVSDLTTSTSGLMITSNNSGATYQWLDCNNNNAVLANETGQSFTATANGSYAVELTENGCVDTTSCVSITTVGIVESSFANSILIYPNPTTGNFSIDLGAVHEFSIVSITDISGKLIDSKTITQSQILNLSIEEPAGVYIISVQAEDKYAVIRLVKE